VTPLLVLRPEPGNSATATSARALGLDVRQIPLFAIEPQPWVAPDPECFDALLLTSANAVRAGGSGLDALKDRDVMAVGEATAAAARGAGFRVVLSGEQGVDDLLARVPRELRLLHLTGVDHRRPAGARPVETIAMYRAVPADAALPAGPCVALVHSARAGERLAALAPDRRVIRVAAISGQAAAACGDGWGGVHVAEKVADGALLALAARLCQE
jgi:uroporphyrinogen-III synthase